VVERRRCLVQGEHEGYSDFFAPIVVRGKLVAVLVAGPFALGRPTSAGVLDRWRRLTGRQGHATDPEFAAYLGTQGGDVHSVHFIDPADKEHLIATPHGYLGTQGNVGIFETTDGGQKWILHKSAQFAFQPHSNIIYPYDPKIWTVSPGTISSSMTLYRTTDGGLTWTNLGNAPERNLGRVVARAGTTFYSSTDFGNGAYKTTDKGATWTKLSGAGGGVGWVATTATKIYSSSGAFVVPTIFHATLANDTVWTSDGTPSGMTANGVGVGSTFDGSHWIIIAGQAESGAWRYVEP
jgi:photosystem II stability/assembly factor-like uncharacterized protein